MRAAPSMPPGAGFRSCAKTAFALSRARSTRVEECREPRRRGPSRRRLRKLSPRLRSNGSRAWIRSFTLVEALIATALLLVVLTQVAQVQRSARLALERVRRPMDWTADLVRGYRQFAADCAHFQNPTILPPGVPVIDLAQVSGDSNTGQIVFYVAEYRPAGGQDIRKVTYRLQDGGLYRLSEPPAAAGSHLPARGSLLVPEVSEVDFALFDGKAFTSQWGSRQGLPQGLRIRFVARDKQRYIWSHLFNGVMQWTSESASSSG